VISIKKYSRFTATLGNSPAVAEVKHCRKIYRPVESEVLLMFLRKYLLFLPSKDIRSKTVPAAPGTGITAFHSL
jgi:hypothetical protein